MRINSIQSYNNYNNRISYKSVVTGNKCTATKVADSISFKSKDPFEALKEYLADKFIIDEDIAYGLSLKSTLFGDADFDEIALILLLSDLERVTEEELIPEGGISEDGDRLSDDVYNIFTTFEDVVDYMTKHKEAFSASRIEGAIFLPSYYKLLYAD